MQQLFEVEQETTPLFDAGSLVESGPVFVICEAVPDAFVPESFTLFETGEVVTEFDTAAEIDQVVYTPFKKGTTHADMEAMGLTVEDNMKTFRSTTATETFFADVACTSEEEEGFDFTWVEALPVDQTPCDLLFADYELFQE